MKKILYIIWGVVVLILICFVVNYISNEQFINNYQQEKYEENKLTAFGFLEPYIEHYNKGDFYYQKGEYEKAVEEYKKAIGSGITEERDCMTRINIALCEIAPINLDNATKDNIEEILNTLKEAKNTLTLKGCANVDGKSGHNEAAQQLWNELNVQIEQLEKEQQQDNGDDGDDEENKKNTTKKPIENKDKKEQQLKEYRDKGQNERGQNIILPEEEDFDDYYSGPKW